MTKQNIYTKQPVAKGIPTIYLQTFSSLLFSLSLSFSLCFSLCLSELPLLCFSFSLSLCFFSEWSLCSLEHRSHRGQRSSARGQTWSEQPTSSNIHFIFFSHLQWLCHRLCHQQPVKNSRSNESAIVLLSTNISTRQREARANVSQWFKLRMHCRCHSWMCISEI